ncbi:TIGR03862 family flavoprotein [Pseudorhodoferax sp.]|uniref:TIGR03862 family flavoprotein n=1 Tax=Pseudorhodoferax sp. TaxID=1993553 RepID=UPI0039E2B8E0
MTVAVVGGGPAGLMAAERLAGAGVPVDLYDAMPSVGRKFLLAGKGGLNLTHSEPAGRFVERYGPHGAAVGAWLARCDAQGVRDWAQGLGIATFVGTSGRVFPADMKAAPLLRAWLHRLRTAGVRLHMRHRWTGWTDDGQLRLEAPGGTVALRPAATVLALGGASWPRLGSDGAWVPLLAARGVALVPLQPANCGFDVAATPRAPAGGGWSAHFAERFAGQPFKSVALRCADGAGGWFVRKGEFVATATGIEGSLVYAASRLLREQIARDGRARLWLDLLPDRTPEQVLAACRHPRGARSLSSHLKSRLALDGIKLALLHELLAPGSLHDPAALAGAIKALPVLLAAPRPVAEAISTAGGVALAALDEHLMLQALPGVFCAGEMLDWEAPTGGYLLTACLASGVAAAEGVLRYLGR